MRKYVHVLLFLLVPAAAMANGPVPIDAKDFAASDPKQAQLGRLLFYDKVLSGNRNISCGTCHHHELGGADGLSLGIGEGGIGVGPKRTGGTGKDRVRKRIPRNAPALWNIGHRSIDILFHDGRLSVSDRYENGFDSPAEEWLPEGLSGIVAAQALFPLTAQFEMAGNPKENEVAGAVHDRIDAAWPILAKRVRVIPEYGDLFVAAFAHIDSPDQVGIADIVNALAAFIVREWKNFDSPYDAWLEGDKDALSPLADKGRQLFFGEAGCSTCHSGPLLSDQDFHALSVPGFGPGRTRKFEPLARDVGRMGKTDRLEDAYRFKTPALRNVALTAPYGHNGAFPTLEAIVRHHLDPEESRATWRPDMANLPSIPWLEAADFIIRDDRREMARQNAALDIVPMDIDDDAVTAIVAFLESLTGQTALDRPMGRPDTVPSGLPVD